MTRSDAGMGPSPEDDALLEELRQVFEIVDPVPSDVIAMGKAAYSLRHLDEELMVMTSGMHDLAAVRSDSATAHLHVFEHGTVAIDVEVTTRGDVAQLIGVVQDSEDAHLSDVRVLLETASSSTPVALDGGQFMVERVPTGLARLVVERAGVRRMTTDWFDVG